MSQSLQDYSKNVGGPWIDPSALLTFFFGPIYLQQQMNYIRSFLAEAKG